jgi:fatty acid desaturase
MNAATTPVNALAKALDAKNTRGEPIADVEMPTLILIVAAYAGWLAVTFEYGRWPLLVVAPLTAVLLTLHSSLQHEIIHGHPTRHPLVNRLLGIVPLALWLPFMRFRENHLAHHNDERVTDPLDDPESYYWTPQDWSKLNPVVRAALRVQQTLGGRIVIGSFWRIGMFLKGEARALWRNRGEARSLWLEHLLWCVPVLLWIKLVCGMPLWLYFVAMVIPANGILLIRSFAEHRASPQLRARIAVVENSRLLGPLFLFNNLHSLHHEEPMIPWYQYNARYQMDRARLIAENEGLVYDSYLEVARRYLFRPYDALLHPLGRVPPRDDQAGSP